MKRAQAIAIFGTGSNVGKSVIAAGLCRLLARWSVKVAPFKAQNMSLNSFVTPEGGEIGRAQALQARACSVPPHVDMNPILLKPESDQRSQVIVHGRIWGASEADAYLAQTMNLFRFVETSYRRLAERFDALVIEGAGSAAEVNLRNRDIANWRVAELADAAVVLVADIDCGGVFAQVIGTLDLLQPDERRRVIGIIVNKFRGDRRLFSDGVAFLKQRTGVPVLGVVPFLRDLRLDEEDSLQGAQRPTVPFSPDRINIAVVLLPRMSNFTDFLPLSEEADVALNYAASPPDLRGADVIIIPGSKNTIEDLEYVFSTGMSLAIHEHVQQGGGVVGICGGYQMLGREIHDPHRVEAGGTACGLGLLDVTTELTTVKNTYKVKALPLHVPIEHAAPLPGYYIHVGRTVRRGPQPCFQILTDLDPAGSSIGSEDGALAGRVWGTYIHGLFDHAIFRRAWLNSVRRRKSLDPLPERISEQVNSRLQGELDRWANHLAEHLDLGFVRRALRLNDDREEQGVSRCG